MKTVLITGGSGLVGRALTKKLVEKGYQVRWLSRQLNQNNQVPIYYCDYLKNEIDVSALENVDVIIHLAGENIGSGRWTKSKKEKVITSRVQTASLILEKLKELNIKPETFISASAVGIYGNAISDKIFTENDLPDAQDFLANVCRQWEGAAHRFETELNCKTVVIRTSMVLSTQSDALERILLPVKLGLSAPLGSGKQIMSWIHIDDLCEIYLKAIEDNSIQGTYNAVSPHFLTNKEFMKIFSETLRKPFFMPRIPSFILKIIMGEAAEMILGGSRVSSQKLMDSNYVFKYADLKSALTQCLKFPEMGEK